MLGQQAPSFLSIGNFNKNLAQISSLYTNKKNPKISKKNIDIYLKEIYNEYFHPSKLPIEDKRVWKALHENNVLNVFQFDSDVGSQAAKKIKPNSILEMADANGLMRLMTSEKGQETPMEKYVRYKNNIQLLKLKKHQLNFLYKTIIYFSICYNKVFIFSLLSW